MILETYHLIVAMFTKLAPTGLCGNRICKKTFVGCLIRQREVTVLGISIPWIIFKIIIIKDPYGNRTLKWFNRRDKYEHISAEYIVWIVFCWKLLWYLVITVSHITEPNCHNFWLKFLIWMTIVYSPPAFVNIYFGRQTKTMYTYKKTYENDLSKKKWTPSKNRISMDESILSDATI